MPEDQERSKIIIRYYGMLQGLKAIPFGMLLFILAFQDLGWLGEAGNCSVTLPLFLVMLAFLFAIDQYYVNHLGRVKPVNRRTQMQETTVFLSIFALVIVLENFLQPPFSLLGVAVGGLFFWIGINSKRYYYLPLGAMVVIASFLPWFLAVPLTDPVYGSLGVMLKMVFGLVIMLAGVIDHFMLMRALKQFDQKSNNALGA